MAVSFLTGQRLTADLLNNNIIGYLPVTYTKLAATSRASTVTVTDDPELTAIPLGVGTWEIEVIAGYTTPTTTTTNPGLRTLWGFTGTWSGTTIRYVTAPGSGNVGAPTNADTAAVAGRTLDTQEITYQSSNSAIYSQVREISRAVVVTVAGNFSFKWAQSLSTVNVTNLQQTSTVTVRKISA